MVLFVIYRESVETQYRTSICSKATALILFINFLMFTIPFLFAYNTQGFWLKSNTYDEQPDIHFIYEYFVMIETDDIENPVICTTLEPIASSMEDFNHCPVIKVEDTPLFFMDIPDCVSSSLRVHLQAREEDFNKDGKYDKLFFEVESLIGTRNVFEVTAVLLFDYKLSSHSWFQMQTLGWIELSSALGGGRVDSTADLRLHQRALLGHKGRDLRYNSSVVTAKFPHEFSLFKLLSSFTERNVTTRLENIYSVWNRARDPDEPFVFTLELNYPEETVRYRPGTWQVVKIAWMQYLALFYLSILVGRKLKHFILDNRLVNNVRCYPWKKLI